MRKTTMREIVAAACYASGMERERKPIRQMDERDEEETDEGPSRAVSLTVLSSIHPLLKLKSGPSLSLLSLSLSLTHTQADTGSLFRWHALHSICSCQLISLLTPLSFSLYPSRWPRRLLWTQAASLFLEFDSFRARNSVHFPRGILCESCRGKNLIRLLLLGEIINKKKLLGSRKTHFYYFNL